ncbi:MAG: hypothetical protein Q7S86_04200 [bacterium]|nr:hypothetical protein [bacterium]
MKTFLLVPALFLAAAIVAAGSSSQASFAGSYRCLSANAGGVSSVCRQYPRIVLKTDGTYTVSSEKGTYVVKDNTVKLSASKLRGIGKIVDGNKIRFEYDYNRLHHVVTYLKEQTIIPDTKKNTAKHIVEADLSLVFPDGYGVDYFNVVELVPPISSKLPTYQTTTYASDKHTLKVYFSNQKGVMSGYLYDIYASTGSERVKVGTLDLTNESKKSIALSISAKP